MTANGSPLRVLVVDDSPTVRAVLRRMIEGCEDLDVVAEANDGLAAVQMTRDLAPDVILMDITMPNLDGLDATTQIMQRSPTAVLMFSTEVHLHGNRTIFEAYECGARSVLAKPSSPEGWMELSRSLPELVRTIAADFQGGSGNATMLTPAPEEIEPPIFERPIHYLAIGASTGGPEALRELLAGLAPKPPMAVLVVQHIASEFENGLVDWLRGDLDIEIALARDGERVRPGEIRLAPQGAHMRLTLEGRLELDRRTPPLRGHRPSANELLNSCALVAPRQTAGILLSGMGRDGVDGLLAIRQNGGLTLVQDQITSVVFGMPQAALEAGAADQAMSPKRLASHLLRSCGMELK